MADLVLLRVPLEDGSNEFVEVQVTRAQITELAEEGVVLAANDGMNRFVAAGFTFASAVDRILPSVAKIVTSMRDHVRGPDEFSIEVSLMLGGETGIIFAKGTAEANFTLNMTWRRGASG